MEALRKENRALRAQLNQLRAQKKYAWFCVYDQHAYQQDLVSRLYELTIRLKNDKQEEFPQHLRNELIELAEKSNKKYECPVCLEHTTRDTFSISYCGHIYCKDCLGKLKETNNPKCAVCRRKL